MATYNWRSGSGAFDDASNWSPAIVPGSGDTALFAQNGGTIYDSGSVDIITFSAYAWIVNAQLSANTATVTTSALIVDGSSAQLLVNSALSVFSPANSGNAVFTISDGGVVSVTQGASSSFGNAAVAVVSRGIGNFNGALSLGNGGATTATVDSAVLTVGGILQFGPTGYGSATLTIQDGGETILTAAADASTTYLQLGAVANGIGVISVTGTNSLLLLTSNSGGVGVYGSGELEVTSGGTARFNSSNNALNPALVIGVQSYSTGNVIVSGSGSTVVANGSVIVGQSGSGILRIFAGGVVDSSSITSAQSALSVGARASGYGSVFIDGTGSALVAAGSAVIGGDNRGSGTGTGGTGGVTLTNGGLLETDDLTLEAGSSITIDGTSQESVFGNLNLYGSLINFGTLSISGFASGSGTLVLGGGFTNVGNLAQTNVRFTAPNATLRISAITGTSQISGMQAGDQIDLVGNASVFISGNDINTSSGSLILSGVGPYTLSSDGSGGTFVTLGEDTIGVFRFFDTDFGTHFFTSSSAEQASIAATRPDLVYEGVGLQAVDPSAGDPAASPVYRFFDSNYGTHFFTASAAERDTVIASRPDLVYEGMGFLEHTSQEAGDVAVYRFFDASYGTHFYTASDAERATIVATRPDLVYEGIGFYAPS